MIKKFYTSAGWTRKCMTLMIMALCAITAQAYTTISDVVIGNFKYNIYQATAAGEVTHAGCSGLSSAGASLTDVTIPGYVTYNGQRLRVQDVGYAFFTRPMKTWRQTRNIRLSLLTRWAFLLP